MSPVWDPPALALVLGGMAALAAWLVLSPPRRAAPLAAGLQLAATLLLGLALLNAGWRSGGSGGEPTLAILIDRSASMDVAATGGPTRRASAEEWLAGREFARWSAGWRVEIDSFGGHTTDPATAIEAAAAGLPGAILVVGDGRATGGRAAAAPGLPLFVHAPGPTTLADGAVLDLAVEEDERGAALAVEVSAVGGEPTPERELVIRVADRVVARARAPALVAGERRIVRVALPAAGAGERVVEARLAAPEDPVPENDARSIAWRPDAARRTLLVGLDPGWEMGVLRRALDAAGADPLDVVWSGVEGTLRRIDGGGAVGWTALDPAAYGTLWLVGDPGLLGPAGQAWLARFLGAEGRGVYWAAGPAGGELVGARAPAGGSATATPVVTDAGRRWLASLGEGAGPLPDGSPSWPPIEGLPGLAVDVPAGARVLARAGPTPVAWAIERAGNRTIVTLGTGWYRLALGGGEAGRAFWARWIDGASRWLGGASPAARPLVSLPPGGRVRAGEPFEARLDEGAGPARWRVTPAGGGAETASGSEAGGAIALGPLPPGAWRLEVSAQGRTETRALAVEEWTPDLARTEADTVSLAAAARSSGGGIAGRSSLPREARGESLAAAPAVGLGLAPWAFLVATLLLLGHWAAAARSR